MLTSNQVRLIAWSEFEFIRRTLAVRRGGARLDWVGTNHRVSFSEMQRQAQALGLEGRATNSANGSTAYVTGRAGTKPSITWIQNNWRRSCESEPQQGGRRPTP
jgi:hypothetical protein